MVKPFKEKISYNARKAKRLRKLLIKAFFGKCWFKDCEETENLEFFHIKSTDLNGRGRGRWQRIYDVINNPCSYGLACKKHYRFFDVGIIEVKDFVM